MIVCHDCSAGHAAFYDRFTEGSDIADLKEVGAA
jgi:hypothetical protein